MSDMKAENAIAWLIEEITEQANGYENNKGDMERRLMKIAGFAYAIEVLERHK